MSRFAEVADLARLPTLALRAREADLAACWRAARLEIWARAAVPLLQIGVGDFVLFADAPPEARVLAALAGAELGGVPATLRDLADTCGWASTNAPFERVRSLTRMGFLAAAERRSRRHVVLALPRRLGGIALEVMAAP